VLSSSRMRTRSFGAKFRYQHGASRLLSTLQALASQHGGCAAL
jgi:hypothetical protein